MMLRLRLIFTSLICLLLFSGCETQTAIVSSIDEKEANIIIVLLKSKGIIAQKGLMSASGAADQGGPKYQILVDGADQIDAISYLNQNGFPRSKSTTLLDLFSAQGLMTSDKEASIRYNAGLESQLSGMILMIDGVIDAQVQLSFPPEETVGMGTQTGPQKKITAAVYVKHQGIIDDPNTHLENKIKRLISGSITGLDLNDVTVVSDRSRFTDITVTDTAESLSSSFGGMVRIWSISMNEASTGRFRFIFFCLLTLLLLFAVLSGWLIWKIYPTVKGKGFLKALMQPTPVTTSQPQKGPLEP